MVCESAISTGYRGRLSDLNATKFVNRCYVDLVQELKWDEIGVVMKGEAESPMQKSIRVTPRRKRKAGEHRRGSG